MNTQTKKTSNREAHHERKIIYVFQGGGALGSFQVGGVEALYENDYRANMVVGISIGGFNAAIIAGNPPEKRVAKLKQFWDTITTHVPFPNIPFAGCAKVHNSLGAHSALLFGQQGFFSPRPMNPWLIANGHPEDFSFYDTTPMRETLKQVIDFDYLNAAHVRLCLGVTDLENGDFIFFDNTKEKITADHILASGALPPGFPAIKIDGRYYVDGGVYANTPLSKVLDEFADNESNICNVLCFMFDLFSASGPLPHSMDGMLERIKDIQYSSHSKRSNAIYATTQNLSHAIRFLGDKLPPEVRNDPQVQEVLKLGHAHRLDLVHVIYHSTRGTELHSKDYNFSAETAQIHYQQGYDITKQLIQREAKQWDKYHSEGTTIYTIDGNKAI
ncbi:MAG: patatin-like phospholipase family protein [Proteobacteria bacterium]|nr:MAG: patatin-like phospholipase family protein [Pseudomonadota bacterium]